MRFAHGVALFLFALSLGFPKYATSKEQSAIVVFSSSDAAGTISAERLKRCLHQLAREWKQNENTLPSILVFHVSRKVAKAAAVTKKVELRRNHGAEGIDLYYEIWIVDEPEAREYVLVFENLIEDHFHLKPTDDERMQVMKRTLRVQTATLSVLEGK